MEAIPIVPIPPVLVLSVKVNRTSQAVLRARNDLQTATGARKRAEARDSLERFAELRKELGLSDVSRMQIAESVRPTLTAGPASREDLLAAAERAGAEEGVLSALEALPEGKRFSAVRDLWTHLRDVPVMPRG
jgi:Protein of unknown function (DUF2795)